MMIDIIYENCNNLTSVKNWQLIIKRTKYIIRYVYLIAFLWREKYIILWQYNKVFIIFICQQTIFLFVSSSASNGVSLPAINTLMTIMIKKAIFEFN